MTVERKNRTRAVGVMDSMISIEPGNALRDILFDINYQLQKILGYDNHTLAFQCAVNGVVYGVTVTREDKRLTCKLLSFIDNQEAHIFFPAAEHALNGLYATTKLRADFDLKVFSNEIEVLFGQLPAIARRRLASVIGPEVGAPLTLEDQFKEAQAMAAELAGEGAEPLQASLGVAFPSLPIIPAGAVPQSGKISQGRRRSVVYIPEKEPSATAIAGVRARIHSVFLGRKEEKRTVMLDGAAARVIQYLLTPDMRRTLATRNTREPMRRQFVKGAWQVLYANHTQQGVWLYAGPEGLQNRNRIFIPFQLEGSHVRIPPDAPWQLIADMLGQ